MVDPADVFFLQPADVRLQPLFINGAELPSLVLLEQLRTIDKKRLETVGLYLFPVLF